MSSIADSPARRTRSRLRSMSASSDGSAAAVHAPSTSAGGIATRATRRSTRAASVASATGSEGSATSSTRSSRRTSAPRTKAQKPASKPPKTPHRRARRRTLPAVSEAVADDAEDEVAPAGSGASEANKPIGRDADEGEAGSHSDDGDGAGAGAGVGSGSHDSDGSGESGDSDSSDDSSDEGSGSSGSDSDDPELDHLVAISSHAIKAFSAAMPTVKGASTAEGKSSDAIAQASAAAALTLASSSETFAGMSSGAKYLRYANKKGIHAGARLAGGQARGNGAPATAVSAVTEKQAAAPLTDAKKKRTESKNTFGKNWFNVPSTQMTAAVKRDLQIVQMRNYLDPKRYYKASDSSSLPQQFQMGTVVEAAHEFKSSRLTKRQRQPTIADSLLRDQSFKKYAKRQYDLVSKERKAGKGSNLRNKWWKRA